MTVSLLLRKNLFVLLPHSHFVNVWSISTAPSYFNPSHFIKVWNFCQTFSILHCPWIVSTIVRIKPWGVRNDNSIWLKQVVCCFLRYSHAIVTSKTTTKKLLSGFRLSSMIKKIFRISLRFSVITRCIIRSVFSTQSNK